jgi:beta-alanine degradation protein BauB
MKTRRALSAAVSVLVLSGIAVAIRASGQDATTTRRVPQFENDEVKVWKSVVLPNAPLPPHRHDHPRVLVVLAGGTMKIVESGGASESHDWPTGTAQWLAANPPGTLHSDVNAGDKPIEVMVIELKKSR